MSKLMEWLASPAGQNFMHDYERKFFLDCMEASLANSVDAGAVVFDMKIEAEDIMNDDTGPQDCPLCHGSGGLAHSPCNACHGEGEV